MSEGEKDPDWSECETLSEFIYRLVGSKQTSSPDFQALIRALGKERVKGLYLAEKKKREEKT